MIVEAQAAARIKHPNVVAVTDVSRTARGDVFIVMEHIDGVDLEELLAAEATLEIPRARALLTQIASALAAAHAQGVIHRDVKPANCMIMQGTDGAEVVKILDFGIAKILEDDGSTAKVEPATRPWHTRKYAAPEVKHGSPSSARSDVYSLGVLAYRMLTGHFPLGDDLVLKPPEQHRSELPAGLCTLLTDMLQTAPHARPRTMDEVRARLQHDDATEPPLAVRERQTTVPPDTSPDTAPEATEPPPGTSPPATKRGRWVISLVALSLAAGMGATLLRSEPTYVPPMIVNHTIKPEPPKSEKIESGKIEPEKIEPEKTETEKTETESEKTETESEKTESEPPKPKPPKPKPPGPDAHAKRFVKRCLHRQAKVECLDSAARATIDVWFSVADGRLTNPTVETRSGTGETCLQEKLVACTEKRPPPDSYTFKLSI